MTQHKLVWTPPAVEDLKEIWAYIHKRSRSASTADNTVDTVLDAIEVIRQAPGVGHRRADLTSRDFLFRQVFSYLIVYQVESTRVVLHALIHSARDVAAILEDR